MAKNTKALSGPAKRKYFRDALAGDPGVARDAAERLTEKFDSDLSHMRVRQHVSLGRVSGPTSEPKKAAPKTAEAPTPVIAAPAQPAVPMPPAAPAASSPAPFDPHAFSLIVVMTRQGADGLKRTLETIGEADHLRALAKAQHVAIDAALTEPADLRTAIIAGTAQRIADRRAAAS